LYQYNIWYTHSDRLVCKSASSCLTCILGGQLHRLAYTRCIDTINSPDDEHEVARNMYRIVTNVWKKRIVRQLGYLLELYQDALSTKHKIKNNYPS
jgi:hypothetical protein